MSAYRLRLHRNGIWRITWTLDRITRSRSTGERDHEAAKRALERFVLEQRDGALARPTIADVLELYLADRRGRAVAFQRLEHACKPLNRILGRLYVDELKPLDSRRYAATRRDEGRQDGTIAKELSTLRTALRFGYDEGVIAVVPPVRIPSRPAPRERWITREEAERLLEACEAPHLRLFALLAMHTGARSEAIRELTWDRIDFANALIDFRTPGRKATKKIRAIVPMNSTLARELEKAGRQAKSRWVVEYHGGPVGDVRHSLERACREAGIEDFSPHVWRHSVANWLDQAKVALGQVAGVLGHRSSVTTERVYLHRQAEGLRAAVEAIA